MLIVEKINLEDFLDSICIAGEGFNWLTKFLQNYSF